MNQFKSMPKKNIVVIGGGNGSAVTLNAVKKFADKFNISAVISTTDSTGSSGTLRKEFKTLPVGDILRAVLALSKYDYNFLKQIFYRNRFTSVGKLDKHNIGNLFLVLGEHYDGSLINSIRALEQAIEAQGQVYPATLERSDIVGELSNGQIVKEEGNLDRPQYDRNLLIKKMWIEPEAKAYTEAKEVIKSAHYIILGPGSLYTSIIATILPKGIKQAIAENKKAKLIYVIGNACHTDGETGPKDVTGIVKALDSYLPRPLDLIIYNESKLTMQQKEKYIRKGWTLLLDNGNLLGKRLLRANYELNAGGVCPIKLGKILKKILCK